MPDSGGGTGVVDTWCVVDAERRAVYKSSTQLEAYECFHSCRELYGQEFLGCPPSQ